MQCKTNSNFKSFYCGNIKACRYKKRRREAETEREKSVEKLRKFKKKKKLKMKYCKRLPGETSKAKTLFNGENKRKIHHLYMGNANMHSARSKQGPPRATSTNSRNPRKVSLQTFMRRLKVPVLSWYLVPFQDRY